MGSAADGPQGTEVPDSALDVTWTSDGLPRTAAGDSTGTPWPGRWVHKDVLVYGDENGVRGYDTETGRRKWRVEPPEGAGEPCAMSAEASSDGVGAVLFDAGGDECSFLAAVDLDSGRVAWSKKLVSEYGENVPKVFVGSESISVALNSVEGMTTFDVRTGAPADPFTPSGIDCRFQFVFSAEYVVAKPECRDEMVVIDTQHGGKPVKVSDQHGSPVKILSDSPLRFVVTKSDDEDGDRELLTFEDHGEHYRTEKLEGAAAHTVFDDADNRLSADGLYFCKVNDGYHAVIDLNTGKAVWKADRSLTEFIGFDGGRVLIARPDPDTPYWTRVGLLDPGTGDVTDVGTMVMRDGTYLAETDVLYAHDMGKVMAVGDRASDGKRMIVAFGVELPAS
jgi:outer membrane protein assembly factor BamB